MKGKTHVWLSPISKEKSGSYTQPVPKCTDNVGKQDMRSIFNALNFKHQPSVSEAGYILSNVKEVVDTSDKQFLFEVPNRVVTDKSDEHWVQSALKKL